jgi:hypothetical protein
MSLNSAADGMRREEEKVRGERRDREQRKRGERRGSEEREKRARELCLTHFI